MPPLYGIGGMKRWEGSRIGGKRGPPADEKSATNIKGEGNRGRNRSSSPPSQEQQHRGFTRSVGRTMWKEGGSLPLGGTLLLLPLSVITRPTPVPPSVRPFSYRPRRRPPPPPLSSSSSVSLSSFPSLSLFPVLSQRGGIGEKGKEEASAPFQGSLLLPGWKEEEDGGRGISSLFSVLPRLFFFFFFSLFQSSPAPSFARTSVVGRRLRSVLLATVQLEAMLDGKEEAEEARSR